MHFLPTELQLYIFDLATHVPHLLEIKPKGNDPFSPACEMLDILIESFRQSLPTRVALTLVSRTFNALSTPLLYACLHLTPSTTPRILPTIDSSKSCMVHHVIMDFPLRSIALESLEHNLISLFSILHDVHTLSIRALWRSTQPMVPLTSEAALACTMAESLGPTLRKLVLYCFALELFYPSHLDTFMTSLINLEVLACPHLSSFYFTDIPLPASLPRLTYINVNDKPFAFPPVTPTHVRSPLNKHLRPLLSPALAYLSLTIPEAPYFDIYASLRAISPNLVTLSLSGTLSDIKCILTDHPFPDVSHLNFAYIYQEYDFSTASPIIDRFKPRDWTANQKETWVELVVGLRSRSNASVTVVSVSDEAFVRALCGGQVDVSGFERCGFAVQDGKGRALVDRVRAGGCPEDTP